MRFTAVDYKPIGGALSATSSGTWLRLNQHQHLDQHGFVQRRSTQTQQLLYINDLVKSYNTKTQLDIIYLDFSKAFDKVSHHKLLRILDHYNLNYKLVSWIKSFLFNRTQRTVVNNCFSHYIPVTSGVPQGSVLGPLLFITYLQDLINTVDHYCSSVSIYAFADDLKIFSSNPVELQHALNITTNWIKLWNLHLNTAKSEHITIQDKTSRQFYIGNEEIPKVKSVRDLGVTLTSDMKWNTYINKVKARAINLSNIILHTFSPHHTHLLINLYKSYIRPIVEYNTCTWSPHLKNDISQIESVQKNFTRRLCQRSNIKYSSYEDRLKIFKLETLESRRVKNDLVMLYKIVNQIVDINFSSLFQFSSFGGYSMRRHKLHIRCLHNFKSNQNFFSCRVVSVWNSLPEDIVTSCTLSVFRRKLKSISF